MGKDKLRKFAENLTFANLVQPEFDDIFRCDYPLKGRWSSDFFRDPAPDPEPESDLTPDPEPGIDGDTESATGRPIILELGCGRGEYTVGLGAANPGCNFIGIDIKGARMWRGAKTATEMGMANVGFLRTRIEFIRSFFAPGEVSAIWITFPDPQLKKGREKKRLTSPVFLAHYAQLLAPDGVIHLKTDSRELHDYTLRVIEANGLPCQAACADIYGVGGPENRADTPCLAATDPRLTIKTAYERRFLDEGKPITYLRFGLGSRSSFEMVYDE